jgi:diguanylate cyclase
MDNPHISYPTEQSAEYAGKALALMAELHIPPHPGNFAVWYCYCSGEWPELNGALDVLISNGERLDEQRIAALHHKICGRSTDTLPVHVIADRIEAELAEVLRVLGQAGQDAHEYSLSLRSVVREVTPTAASEEVLKVIGRLLSRTRTMALHSRELEKQLLVSSMEIGNLKAELEGARREAKTDPLTGLANRKVFQYELNKAMIEAQENSAPLSLLMLDIDHFKKFNDDYGHVVGDSVLKLLALVLHENVKGQDIAARYGGEEFAAVLPCTKGSDARKLADTIRLKIAGRKLLNRKTGAQLNTISVSIGLAQYKPGETAAAFVERADRALYAAKRLGRNRVIAAEDIRGNFLPQQHAAVLEESS